MEARVAVIYYSATGNVHGLAGAVAEGAEAAGVQVRLRHVEALRLPKRVILRTSTGAGTAHRQPRLRQTGPLRRP